MKTVCAKIVAAAFSLAFASAAARLGRRRPPNVGTAVYDRRDLNRAEWTERDAVRLSGRMIVGQLLPGRVPDGAAFLRHWQLIAEKTAVIGDAELRDAVTGMVADAVGGYAHAVMWPNVRASYYEGHGTYDVAERLHGLLRKIKFVLGTDGLGWATPAEVALAGVPAADGAEDEDAVADGREDGACAGLLLTAAKKVPIPAFDDDVHPGSVAMPFADGRRLFGLHKPWTCRGLPLLAWYYRMAVRCTANDPHRFRREVNHWLNGTVRPLLTDGRSRWYPALAGAARVIRAAAAAADDDSRRSKRMAEERWPFPAELGTDRSLDDDSQSSTPMAEEHLLFPPEPEVDWPSCDDENGRGRPVRRMSLPNIFSVYLLVTFVTMIAVCLIIHFGRLIRP